MNKSKAKGTRFENVVLNYLLAAGFENAERSAAGTWSRDFTGTGQWVVEAKCHKVARLSEWVLRMRACSRPWALFMRIGDQRAPAGYEVVVMSVDDWIELVSR